MSLYRFATGRDKGRYLGGAAEDDARDPAVIALARSVPPGLDGDLLLLAWVQSRLAYAGDAGGIECFDDAARTLRRGWDDCDGLARVLLALLLARGSQARLRAVLGGPTGRDYPAQLSDDPAPALVLDRIRRGALSVVYTLAIESGAAHLIPPEAASLRHLQVELRAPSHPRAESSGWLLLEATRELPAGSPR